MDDLNMSLASSCLDGDGGGGGGVWGGMRKRGKMEKPRILFTGVGNEEGLKIVKKLGGFEAKSVVDCTHLITCQPIKRTIKFMCALARGLPILPYEWLFKCQIDDRFSDPKEFLIRDREAEKKYKFDLRRSLTLAARKPIFSGLTFYSTEKVMPIREELKDIIECAGGKLLPKLSEKLISQQQQQQQQLKTKQRQQFKRPTSSSSSSTSSSSSSSMTSLSTIIIISCPEDRGIFERLESLGFPVVNSEFVMTGVLRQSLEFEEFKVTDLPQTATTPPSPTPATKKLKNSSTSSKNSTTMLESPPATNRAKSKRQQQQQNDTSQKSTSSSTSSTTPTTKRKLTLAGIKKKAKISLDKLNM